MPVLRVLLQNRVALRVVERPERVLPDVDAIERRLQRVEVNDQIKTDRVINELMGKDASARFRFIMERADEAEELDV